MLVGSNEQSRSQCNHFTSTLLLKFSQFQKPNYWPPKIILFPFNFNQVNARTRHSKGGEFSPGTPLDSGQDLRTPSVGPRDRRCREHAVGLDTFFVAHGDQSHGLADSPCAAFAKIEELTYKNTTQHQSREILAIRKHQKLTAGHNTGW